MRSTIRLAMLLAGVLVAAAAAAQPGTYPTKPVRFIVGFPPGGAADILGRITAQKVSEVVGQQIVVDNRAGAGSVIATEIAARSTPDGYTLLFTSPPHAINPSLYRKVAYDPIRDFVPVIQVVSTAMVLGVHPSVTFRTVPELVAYAKANPGKLSYGSGGSGATGHLAMEFFKSVARVDILHVPYKGTGPVLNDLIAGQINMTVGSAAPMMPQVRAGKVRGLAVTGRKRSSMMPELPTVAESGFPEYEVTQWFGVLAPAGTPRPVIATLNAAVAKAIEQPDARERYLAQGVEPVGGTSESLGVIVGEEVARWSKLVKALKLSVD